MKETIGQKLDRLEPATCLACSTSYKRMDAKWINGSLRNICTACGLDQTSDEAGLIAHAKGQLWHQAIS